MKQTILQWAYEFKVKPFAMVLAAVKLGKYWNAKKVIAKSTALKLLKKHNERKFY